MTTTTEIRTLGAFSPNLTNHEYRAVLDGVTSTDLRRYMKAPKLMTHQEPQTTTPARNIGQVTHLAFCGNWQAIADEYAESLHPDGRKKEAKAERREALERGIILLKSDEWNGAHEAAKTAHTVFDEWLARNAPDGYECVQEVPLVAVHYGSGQIIKSRTDVTVRTPAGVYIIDLKTTTDATLQGFRKQARNHDYITQLAHYCEVQHAHEPDTPILGAAIIAVEAAAPYLGAVHPIDSEALMMARMNCAENYAQIRGSFETGVWGNIQPGVLYADSEVVQAKHPEERIRRAMHLVASGMSVTKAAKVCEVSRHKLRYHIQKNPLNI